MEKQGTQSCMDRRLCPNHGVWTCEAREAEDQGLPRSRGSVMATRTGGKACRREEAKRHDQARARQGARKAGSPESHPYVTVAATR